MSSFGRLPKKYQNVCVDIVVQWGRELVSMCLDQGFKLFSMYEKNLFARNAKFLGS